MKKLNIIDKLHIYTIKNVPVALQTKKIYTGTTVKVIEIGEFGKNMQNMKISYYMEFIKR